MLWFAESSAFRNRLTAAFDRHGLSIQISSFLWSGANSIRERDSAALNLAEQIHTERLTHPNSNQLLIAHSHGGNVALRALDQLAVAHDEIFIATLATPFVEIVPFNLPPKDNARTEDLLAFLAASLTLPPNILVVEALHLPYIMGLIVLFPAGMGCAKLFIFWLRRWRTKNAAQVAKLVQLTDFPFPPHSQIPNPSTSCYR